MTMEDQKQAVANGDHSNKLSTSRFSAMLGSKDRDYLISPSGVQVKISSLEGKVIGLYFGANWYPLCRSFVQVLIDMYEQLSSRDLNFEVIYVSSDEDLDAFTDYHACMPWLAIPFSDLETRKALSRKYEVEGIPCLVILQPNNEEEDETLLDGVTLISRYGVRAFPFTKERLEQLRKEEMEKHENQSLINLLTSHGRDYILGHPGPKQVDVASLVGKTVGLFFSAQWCVPSVEFTPKLISVYCKIKEIAIQREEDFEIVFVSSDRDQLSFDSYFGSMPWLSLPFGDPAIKNLARHFDVQGIPCLIIIGPDGKTVTRDGRNLLNMYQENAYPFNEDKVALLERQVEEEAKSLPRLVSHEGHRHELNLVSEGNGGGPFICCDCEERGAGWAYQCLECGYEVHTKCVKMPNSDSAHAPDNSS